MWDVGTALMAVAVVSIGAVVLAPIARGVGGFCAVIGFFGVTQSRTWAPTVMALGLLAWFVGHWSFAVRHDACFRSRLARALFDETPLKWTLPQHWQIRQQCRAAARA